MQMTVLEDRYASGTYGRHAIVPYDLHFGCAVKEGILVWNKKNSRTPADRVLLARQYSFESALKEFEYVRYEKQISRDKGLTLREKELAYELLEAQFAAFYNSQVDWYKKCMNCWTSIHHKAPVWKIDMWIEGKTSSRMGEDRVYEVLCMPCARNIRGEWLTGQSHSNSREIHLQGGEIYV